ncbi:TIM barrel protein [Caballeronia sp. LZ019]|uniref:sugar phosphate isomerase/epimerase family protein n=1 Tax=Caballeronia sp. LZ019 TaxID=3038555 RepID=UPI00285E5FDD|nr:TIM barrel protein [Caballeronia sp. LZ019]MDR5809218.1 TIM barrel protein [Caballeronia sp. LZ019]
MRQELKQISLANLAIGRVPQVDLVRAAANAGFGKVGLLLMTATDKPLEHEVLGRPEVIREVKAALADTGVKVFDVEAFVLCPETDIERFKPALALGAEFGATHISTIGTAVSATSFLSDQQRVELFGNLCDEAARHGLSVGVEFMLYRDIRTWREALGLVEAAGRSNAGLIMDILHFFRAGSQPEEIGQIPVERLAYAQLSDCVGDAPSLEDLPQEARTSRFHLGHGVIPINTILDQLPGDIQIVIETPVKAEADLSTFDRATSVARRTIEFFSSRQKITSR